MHIKEDCGKNFSTCFLQHNKTSVEFITGSRLDINDYETRSNRLRWCGKCGFCPAESWFLCSGQQLWSSRSEARTLSAAASWKSTRELEVPASCWVKTSLQHSLLQIQLLLQTSKTYRGGLAAYLKMECRGGGRSVTWKRCMAQEKVWKAKKKKRELQIWGMIVLILILQKPLTTYLGIISKWQLFLL